MGWDRCGRNVTANCLVYLSQESYLKQVLKHFGMANAYLVSIPGVHTFCG